MLIPTVEYSMVRRTLYCAESRLDTAATGEGMMILGVSHSPNTIKRLTGESDHSPPMTTRDVVATAAPAT